MYTYVLFSSVLNMHWNAALKWLSGVAGSTLVATLLATGLASILQRWVGRDLAETQSTLENKKLLYTRELAAYEALAVLAGQSYIWSSGGTPERDHYYFHATDEEAARLLTTFLLDQNKRINDFFVHHSAFVPSEVQSDLIAATNTGTFSPEKIFEGSCPALVRYDLDNRVNMVNGILLNARNRMWAYLRKRAGEPEPPFVDSNVGSEGDPPQCP
jgi:hypothetical protein